MCYDFSFLLYLIHVLPTYAPLSLDTVTTYEQEEDKLPVLVFGTEQVNL